jgi:regulator of sigma E protease
MWVLLWLVTIALLDALLIAHECGHYLVARACRIRVERFTIGFGPTIFERTSRAGTTWRIGLFPLGAFVRIRGLDGADADPTDRGAFSRRPVWQRLATILGGPAASYLGVAAIAMALFTCHGIDVPRWYGVGSVVPGSPAAGQLQPGDIVRAFDHTPLTIDQPPTLADRVTRSGGAPIALTIDRNGEQRDVVIEPKQARDPSGAPIWRLGVQLEARDLAVPLGVVEAARRSLVYPAAQARFLVTTLYRVVVGTERADPGGPVRMVMEFQRAFRSGVGTAILLVMMLGVWLGLFLALPIPLFDGARLLLLPYRAMTRRRSRPAP